MPVVHFSIPLVSNGEGTVSQELLSQASMGEGEEVEKNNLCIENTLTYSEVKKQRNYNIQCCNPEA